MVISEEQNSKIIDGIACGITILLFVTSLVASFYTQTWPTLGRDLLRILTSPGPLVTDYFGIGSLPATFLNAGLCGLVMWLFMSRLKGPSHVNTLAGYFLVIAHAFYGLNFLNMWPCFLAPFLYIRLKNLDYNENLHVCMFSTCFSPFVSELLFRYTQGSNYIPGKVSITAAGIFLTFLLMLLIAFVAPAILPGVKAWHKGYNLYNGGLAYGMLGFLLYNFLYKTMGIAAPRVPVFVNEAYNSTGRDYFIFGNVFFILLFAACTLIGWVLNDRSFKGLDLLFKDTGYQSNFAKKYGMPLCLINIGLYGTLFLIYINLAVVLTTGAGFTGPTFGVIFAALTFSAMGQHPRIVWPILAGYPLLSLVAFLFNHLVGGNVTWTVSTQAYINSIAFATGLCPLVGRYGVCAGIAAGFMCASLCTATSALHGGLMLYNGGFTAGITTLILLPVLEHYVKQPRTYVHQHLDLGAMMTVNEKPRKDK